ncbi:MAG: hypothetical protein HZB92_07105 [Euryarchaeota archaeon]|nr:hypothetical protein [Euryarchaeota archaeon]
MAQSKKRGQGRPSPYKEVDDLVDVHYKIPTSMANEISKRSAEKGIKKNELIRSAIGHYFDCKMIIQFKNEVKDEKLGYVPIQKKMWRLYQIIERSGEHTDEVIEQFRTEIINLMERYRWTYDEKDKTSQVAVLRRIIRKIKEKSVGLDELPEFHELIKFLTDEILIPR